jgi:hypothetical protein
VPYERHGPELSAMVAPLLRVQSNDTGVRERSPEHKVELDDSP